MAGGVQGHCSKHIWRTLGAIGVLLAAWAALLFRLSDIPPGVQHDQVFNIVDAIELLYGRYRIYFPANYGREPLFIYSAAALFRLAAGYFIWGLRLTSAVWAVLGVATGISLARRKLQEPAATVAVLLMAGSFWFLFTGRVGLRAISALTLGAAMVYWLDRGLAKRSWRAFLAAGVCGGIAIYTYLSARALLALAPLLLSYEVFTSLARAVAQRGRSGAAQGRIIWGLLSSWLVTLAVSAPLLLYLRANPGSERRVGELAGPLAAAAQGRFLPLLRVMEEGAATLLWHEPTTLPYHYNLPGRPALTPILAGLFLVGLALTLAGFFRSRQDRLWVTALALGLGPALITPGGPFYLRAIVALPLIYVLVGGALWAVGGALRRWWLRRASAVPLRHPHVLAGVAVVVLVAGHWAESAGAYFVRWPAASTTERIYNADLRAAARYTTALSVTEPVYISTDFWLDLDQQTYLLYEPARTDVGWFYGPRGLPLPGAGAATYIWTISAENGSAALAALGAAAQRSGDLLTVARLDAVTVDVLLGAAGVKPFAMPLAYGAALTLVGAGSVPVAGGIELVTRWQVAQPWERSLPPKIAAVLEDATGYRWAQTDDALAVAYQGWQAGQQFIQVTRLELPGDIPPGDYHAIVNIYDDRDGAVGVAANGQWLADTPAALAVSLPLGAPVGETPAPPRRSEHTSGAGMLTQLGVWDAPAELLSGVPAQIRVTWRAEKTLLTDDLAFRLEGRDATTGAVLWMQDAQPLQPLPASWPAGQTWRLTHTLRPQTAQPGVTAAQLILCALQDGAQLACGMIAQPQVINRPHLMTLPQPPQYVSGAAFGEQFMLAGYDLAETDGQLRVTLYWRTEQPSAVALKRFVHAVDANDRIVAQSDGVPDNGGAPMTTWLTGEYVIDHLTLPAAASQTVRLYVGWYDPATGGRVTVRREAAAIGATEPDGRLVIPLPGRS